MNLINAAKAAGVKHFVHTTFTRNIDREFLLHDAKRAAELYLKESGLEYTILHPGYFMEVWLSPAVGFEAASAKATLYGSGDQKISWISSRDVAAFAVECLENAAGDPIDMTGVYDTFCIQPHPLKEFIASAMAVA